jgi:cysteine synthase A
LRAAVGDTPLLAIELRVEGRRLRVFAKHEALNLTGSIKDRMALMMLEAALEDGELAPGAPIVEASSGNTGISFAAIGRALGHPVRIYMPDWMSRERASLIRSLGAEVVEVSAERGGFAGSVALADADAIEHPGSFRPRQFESAHNVEAHARTTGPELLAQMRAEEAEPTAFVAGVGTGGTVMGVGSFLRTQVRGVRVHPLEPANSPTLRTGRKSGCHRIQGISDEFVPPIVHLAELDSIIDVWDGDAILMAQRMARELGLAVGPSSGANFLGAVKIALGQGEGSAVATVFPDSNKKYLSTDLCREEPVLEHYLAPRIELICVRALPRVGTGVWTERASGGEIRARL